MSTNMYHVTDAFYVHASCQQFNLSANDTAIKCHLHPLHPLRHLNSRHYIATGRQSLQMKARLPLSVVSCSPPLRTIFDIVADRRKVPRHLFPRSRRNENYPVPKSTLLSLISIIEGMTDKVFHGVFFFADLLANEIVYHNVPFLVP